jgi:hypothetical protein
LRSNKKQSQNDFLSEWIPYRTTYLSILLDSEAPKHLQDKCTICLQAYSEIRCLSCIGHSGWCSTCAVKAHQSLPFHRLQRWNGQFYEAISLLNLGFILNLGHNGDVCPLNTDESEHGDQITIVDSAGIFVHLVKWCRCNGASNQDKHLQLLQHRLFSSTTFKPQTAFTFNVLDEFLIDSLECKTSASSFYSKLRRLTNNAFPDTLPVSFQILLGVKANAVVLLGSLS